MHGHFAMKEQPVFSIRPSHPRFGFERFSTCQSRTPFLNYSIDVVWMNRFGPTPPTNLFEGLTKKIQPFPIKVIQVTIGPSSVNTRWSCICGPAKRVFSRSRLIVLKVLTCLHTLLFALVV
jgi:hypothetical protein